MDAKSLIYQFDDVSVDLEKFEVVKADSRARLEPKAFEALVFLIEHRGRLVEKKELLDAVWKDAFVTENAMTRVIAQLRKALGDDTKGAKYIETVPTRGYRFIAEVEVVERNETVQAAATDLGKVVESELTATPGDEQRLIEPSDAGMDQNIRPHDLPVPWRTPILLASLALALLAGVLYYFLILSKPEPTPDRATSKSIAVLPFKPLVAEGRDESLEMGMAETLITKLSGIEQLMIRPMSAVRKYNGPEQDPLAAGREQQADLILEGSFQKSGDRIRVTARLWSVAEGKVLWADKRDQQYEDIFIVQDAIAEQVTRALTLRLAPEVEKRLTRHSTENAEAYYLYVKGNFHLRKQTAEDIRKAITYLEGAVAKDPSYALAYAYLSAAYMALDSPTIGLLSPREAMFNSKQVALTALKLDDTLAEAHIALARTKIRYDWDWQGAEGELKRAIELDPRNPLAHLDYGDYLSIMGALDESVAEMKQALELDPLNVGYNANLGVRLYIARRYDEAIEQYQRTLEMDPTRALHPNLKPGAGWAYEQKGMYDVAISIYSGHIQRQGENPASLSNVGRAHAGAGRLEEAHKVIRDLRERAKRGYVSPYLLAVIYARLGDKDQTIAYLEKAYENRDDWMVWIKVDPVLDVVRSDPSFIDLLRRVGFAS